MENRLTIFESADVAEDVSENVAGIISILADAMALLGIGTDGDDFASQLLNPLKVLSRVPIGARC